jgi:hypothetical protein
LNQHIFAGENIYRNDSTTSQASDAMELLKTFSSDYANGVSAIATSGALLLAVATLWFLKREYVNKYRPYVVAAVVVEPMLNSTGFGISIIPRNVGPHPCEVILRDIHLHIGDEMYDTPSFKEWVLLAPLGIEIRVPVGHVNEQGVQRVREARYKSNRIELTFKLVTRSVEKRFEMSQSIAYEINVLGEAPLATFRPDWIKDA